MANRKLGPAEPNQPIEKLCGPACTVEPNMRGYTEPHIHRVAKWTTPDGFPLHNVYPEPPTTPPKAYYGFERKGGLRRSAEQPSSIRNQTLLDGPELKPYTTGQTQHMSQGSASHWRQWRTWGAVHQRRHAQDRGNSIELDELPRPEARWSGQRDGDPVQGSSKNPYPNATSFRSTRRSSVVEWQIPVTHRSSTRRTLSVSTDRPSVLSPITPTTKESSPVRQAVAYSPVLHCTNPDDQASTKNGHGHAHPTEGVATRGRSFSSRHPRYRPIEPPQVGSPPKVGSPPQVSSPLAGSKPIQRNSRSGSRPGSRPVSPKSNQGSLRRIASENAAMRSRAASPASPTTRPETRDRSRSPGQNFTLRHVQRVCLNQVKPRLQAIQEIEKRFEAISAHEMVSNDIWHDIQRIQAFNASIEADNVQHGSRDEDDMVWTAFLTELELVEKAIEAEDERLRTVSEVRLAQEERERQSRRDGKRKDTRVDSKESLPVEPGKQGKSGSTTLPNSPVLPTRPKPSQIPRPAARKRAGSA